MIRYAINHSRSFKLQLHDVLENSVSGDRLILNLIDAQMDLMFKFDKLYPRDGH